ncbi:MAG TPA: CPBP family glutamic-type intramembrane protease [Verrucomicrobiae bacterium]|nr:CPBP family glutamic-type intramembrane protease [Verrucomicrobiae bacterium]
MTGGFAAPGAAAPGRPGRSRRRGVVVSLLAQALGTWLAARRPGWFWPVQGLALIGGGLVAWGGGAGRTRPRRAALGRAAGVGAGWYAVIAGAARLVLATDRGRGMLADVERRRGSAPLGWRLAILPLAAAGEELVWRGQVLSACRDRLGPIRGGAVATLLGAGVQLLAANPLFPSAAAGWGAVAVGLSDREQGVWPAIAAHAVWSTLALGWPGLPGRARRA